MFGFLEALALATEGAGTRETVDYWRGFLGRSCASATAMQVTDPFVFRYLFKPHAIWMEKPLTHVTPYQVASIKTHNTLVGCLVKCREGLEGVIEVSWVLLGVLRRSAILLFQLVCFLCSRERRISFASWRKVDFVHI